MLHLIFGRAAAGKSTYIYNHIAQNKAEHGNILFIVPEQFTFETERALLHRLGGSFAAKAEVLSFTRMAESAGRLYGGIAGRRVTDAERFILMNNAINKNKPALKAFGRVGSLSAFVRQMLGTVAELKMADVSAEALSSAARAQNGLLQQKLQELALLYAEYNQMLQGVFLDPLDDPERFYKKARENGYFKNKTVYLDAFKGFTGQQLKILHLILRQSKKCYLTLCGEGEQPGKAGAFENISVLAAELTAFARQNGVEVAQPVVLPAPAARSRELSVLERALAFSGTEPYLEPTRQITLAVAKNAKQEVAFVLQTVRRLVREKGYRFGDFVIIARDLTPYEPYLSGLARQDAVPCYFDRRRPLAVSPLVRFALYALRAAQDYNSSAVLSMLKTGFMPFSAKQIGELEEYLFIWNLTGKAWLKPFTLSPEGLTAEADEHRVQNEKRLLELNKIRTAVVQALEPLNRAFGGTAEKVSKALYRLLLSLEANKAVQKTVLQAEEQNDAETADFIAASWDKLMQVLDSIVLCLKEQPQTAQQYLNTFEACVAGITVGNIPHMLDEVSAGSADRIRPSRPKVAFVLGLNQGEFPAPCSEGGLLLKNDRMALEKAGLQLSDCYRRFTIDENFLAYSALTCADQQVYLCRHSFGTKGEACLPSSILEKITAVFKGLRVILQPEALPPQTPGAARYAYLSGAEPNESNRSALKQWLQSAGGPALNGAGCLTNAAEQQVQQAVAAKLFGSEARLSATRLERYYHCPFAYFCQYVLGATRPQRANLNSMQRGTIVHYVLENMLRQHKTDFKTLSREQLLQGVLALMQQYLQLVPGGEQLNTGRFLFIYRELGQTVVQVLTRLQQEFLHSKFLPERFELSIGKENGVPALRLQLPGGGTVSVVGQVDRLDAAVLENERYIRIVDYKTGGKEFALCNVLNGFNMQMLLYLYAVRQGLSPNRADQVAGILYLPAKRSLIKPDGETGNLCMNGLLNNNSAVLQAMDDEQSNRYVPAPTNGKRKNDSFISKTDFETVFSFVAQKVRQAAGQIRAGQFNIAPAEECNSPGSICQYCDYAAVCRAGSQLPHTKAPQLSTAQTIVKMEEELKRGL